MVTYPMRDGCGRLVEWKVRSRILQRQRVARRKQRLRQSFRRHVAGILERAREVQVPLLHHVRVFDVAGLVWAFLAVTIALWLVR